MIILIFSSQWHAGIGLTRAFSILDRNFERTQMCRSVDIPLITHIIHVYISIGVLFFVILLAGSLWCNWHSELYD